MSAAAPRIVLLRSGNRIVVSPTTPAIHDLVTPALRYIEKKFARGAELFQKRKAGAPIVEEVVWECFALDHKDRVATSFGFSERITELLTAAGYSVETRWATASEAAAAAAREELAYKPRWDRIEDLVKSGFEFRHRQREALELIATQPGGRIDCPTGWGKGVLIVLACVLLPKAKIAVITKRVDILEQRLYPELASNLPSVGIVHAGRKVKGRRVMCYSAGCIAHAAGDEDLVFVDEGHEACADKYAEQLGKFDHARYWMFSASWDMRLDNKDMRAEAMAGPVRLSISYQEAVDHKMVAPIEVIWTDVVMDVNPCGGLTDVPKKQAGLWANEYRNKLIAADARLFDADTQVLITVETLEHAMRLKELLPEFKVMFSGQGLTDAALRWFRKEFPDTYKDMPPERRKKITKLFEEGKIRKVIATTVWNVGVDFRNLEVLIRADGGGSPINDTQIPGRNSRINDALKTKLGLQEKKVGILIDYRDQFDIGLHQKSKGREGSYEKNGWTQHRPKQDKQSLLQRLMQWGTPV